MADDPFEVAGASKGGNKPPAMAQLCSGAPERTRTYAPGTPKEIPGLKTRGRLVAITPLKLEKNVKAMGGGTTDRLHADIVVFDGETITDVLDKHGEVASTPEEPWEPPFLLEDFWTNHKVLQGQLQDALVHNLSGNGKPKTVIGVIGRLPKQGDNDRSYALLEATPEEIKEAGPKFKALTTEKNPFD